MRLSDTLPGALCVAAGATLAWHAQGFPQTAVQAYGPGFFPTVLGALLATCGVLLVLRGARAPGPKLPGWVTQPAAWARVAMVPACVVAWLWLGPRIGFLGAAIIPTAIMLAVLTRRPLLSLAIAASTAMAIWLLFAKLLLVPLPVGPLEAWLS
jgi:putative tricarboxylic transport membrane protein